MNKGILILEQAKDISAKDKRIAELESKIQWYVDYANKINPSLRKRMQRAIDAESRIIRDDAHNKEGIV